jgi:hypothetical protein
MAASRSVLRYLWASPASLVGLLLGILACVLGASVRTADGIVEMGGRQRGCLLSRLFGLLRIHAITFGHVVIGADHEALARCRMHEQVHVRQYERWGLLFFPLYLGSSAWQWLRGRDPYWDNHFERQAYHECGSPTPGAAGKSLR